MQFSVTFIQPLLSQVTINQEERQNIINSLISEWEYMKSAFTRGALEDNCGNSGIDVRLQVLDNSLDLHIGDAQYDTNHQGYWGEAWLDYDWEEDELETVISELVDDLLEQIGTWLEIDRISERIIDQRIDDMIDRAR